MKKSTNKTLFVGRDDELAQLNSAFQGRQSQLVVLSGRRRIGKSTLVEKFGSQQTRFFEFQGLHPKEGPTEEAQLKHFSNRMRIYFRRPEMRFSSWLEAFNELSLSIKKGPVVIFFDEISWMGAGSTSFSGELKDAWDTIFKKYSKLMLVLAGSVSSWIHDNILNNSNFLGRVSLHFQLEELSLSVQKQFWRERVFGFKL